MWERFGVSPSPARTKQVECLMGQSSTDFFTVMYSMLTARKPSVKILVDRRSLKRSFNSRSEEHTSELQSLAYLVCRLLLEKKNHLKEKPARCQPAPA